MYFSNIAYECSFVWTSNSNQLRPHVPSRTSSLVLDKAASKQLLSICNRTVLTIKHLTDWVSLLALRCAANFALRMYIEQNHEAAASQT